METVNCTESDCLLVTGGMTVASGSRNCRKDERFQLLLDLLDLDIEWDEFQRTDKLV